MPPAALRQRPDSTPPTKPTELTQPAPLTEPSTPTEPTALTELTNPRCGCGNAESW